MSEKTKGEEVGRTSDVGYTRLSQISGDALTPADIQRSIDGAMRGVIADALRGGSNPQRLDPPEAVRPIDAPTVTTAGEKVTPEKGWYQPKPLEGSSYTDQLVKKLTDELLPHERQSPLRGGEGK
jgi:hypothetical protein